MQPASVFLCILAVASLAQVHASTFYVATDGSDSSNGTSADPFLTFAKALDASAPGDSILFTSGQYSGPSNVGLAFSDRYVGHNPEDDDDDDDVTFVAPDNGGGSLWTTTGAVLLDRLNFACTGELDQTTAIAVSGGTINTTLVEVTGCSVGMDIALSSGGVGLEYPTFKSTGVGILLSFGSKFSLSNVDIKYGTFRCSERAIRMDTRGASTTSTDGAVLYVSRTDFFSGVDLLIDSRTSVQFYACSFETCLNIDNGGGAVYMVSDTSVQFESCKFSHCSASGGPGGAIYAESSSPTGLAEVSASGCEFIGCSSSENGGAVWVQAANFTDSYGFYADNFAAAQGGDIGGANPDDYAASVSLIRPEFRRSRAEWGGSVAIWGFDIDMMEAVFLGCRSEWFGGAVALMDCTTAIANSTFLNNRGGSDDGEGGGLFLGGEAGRSVATISYTDFFKNSNGETGGGASFFNSTVVLEEVEFGYNESLQGGGFSSVDSTVEGSDVVFRNNRVEYDGGGYWCVRSTITMDSVSFLDNSAGHGDGDAYDCYLACRSDLTNVYNPMNDTISC